jgi:integrase
MANKDGHRRFGSVRKRASGRFQARYRGPDGLVRNAPHTFATKGDAERWLTLTEGEIIRGDWRPPEAGQVTLAEYAGRWVAERKLEPRSRDLYAGLLANHLAPFLGQLTLDQISPLVVRRWRAQLLADGRSETTAAKAYRLLRAVLNTATKEDRLIRDNPCRMPGYDKEPTAERPTATVAQVFALADAVPIRFSALIVVAAFTGLRWGELIALRRSDLDLANGTVRVSRKFGELRDGTRIVGPPKSAAGFRTVAVPGVVAELLRVHLTKYAEDGPDALVFTGGKGAVLRRSNFQRAVSWAESVRKAGLPEGFHFHDLRHTGNTLAAASGASTRELMHRMGHASMRAALIYQHATNQRDREIADALGARIMREKGDDEDGAPGVLVPVG